MIREIRVTNHFMLFQSKSDEDDTLENMKSCEAENSNESKKSLIK